MKKCSLCKKEIWCWTEIDGKAVCNDCRENNVCTGKKGKPKPIVKVHKPRKKPWLRIIIRRSWSKPWIKFVLRKKKGDER